MRQALVSLLLVAAAMAVAAGGCVREGAFRCTDDLQCTLGSMQGLCERSAGFCAFPDTACQAGFRYGDQAGSLSNDCVGGDGFVAVGGTVSGVSGTGLVLRNNGGDDLPITADGPFTFSTKVATGSPYDVTIASDPSLQTCKRANAAGSAGGADISDVRVTCATDPGILCAADVCDAMTELCCIKSGVPGCAPTCVGSLSLPVRCSDHNDCIAAGRPTDVCCGTVGSGVVNDVSCTAATTCTGATHAYFCDPEAANPCPDGGSCMPTDDPLPGYHRCF